MIITNTTNLRDAAIEICARLVVKSNKECWTSICEDEGDEYAGPFDTFGVDSETVRTILKDVFIEVSGRVAELQSGENK